MNPQSDFQPMQFGRYLLTHRIAVGGMAEIFNAKVQGAMGFEKSVVIKRILPQYANDTEFLRMFITEAKLVCYLEHPNIVQVHELGEVNGLYYISMEHINGIDGRELWRTLVRRKQRLPVVLSLYIVSEFLKGLDYAHRAVGPDGQLLGVVHRDVSPSNVMLSYRGDVKIGDFGIALVEQESSTEGGVLKGKYGYMSPEQVSGLRVDHRSDIFSAGIVLAELLLGRRLFLGKNDFETLDKVMNARLDVLEQHREALPAEVLGIVERALQREAAERYQTAREFHEEILELLYAQGQRISNETLAAFLARHVVPYLQRTRADDGEGEGKPAPPQGAALQSPVVPNVDPGEQIRPPREPDAAREDRSAVTEDQPAADPDAAVVVSRPPELDEDEALPRVSPTPTAEQGEVAASFVPPRRASAEYGAVKTGRPGEVPAADEPPPLPDDAESEEAAQEAEVVPQPQESLPGAGGAELESSRELLLDRRDAEWLDQRGAGEQAWEGVQTPKTNLALVNEVLDTVEQEQRAGLKGDFSGRLRARTLLKVLFRFCVLRESGLLVVTGPNQPLDLARPLEQLDEMRRRHRAEWDVVAPPPGRTCKIQLVEGTPRAVTADRTEEELVAFLLGSKVLLPEVVERAIADHPQRRPVAALLAAKQVAPLHLPRYVTAYVLHQLVNCFSWCRGLYAFHRKRSCAVELFPGGMDAYQLILKGAANLEDDYLDAYFARVAPCRLVPNRTPPVWIGAFNPDRLLLKIYRSLGESLPVEQALARHLRWGDPRQAKQYLYLLVESDMALLLKPDQAEAAPRAKPEAKEKPDAAS